MAHQEQQQPGASRPFSFQIPPHAAPSAIDTGAAPQEANREWSGFPERRFSTAETPIDENTQTFDDERQAQLLEEARRRYGELNPPSQSATPQPAQQTSSPQPPGKQNVDRVPSAYQRPPPAQQHPAFSAPVAEYNAAQELPVPPHSPGPLPLKNENDFPQARTAPARRVDIQPDSQAPHFSGPPNSHFSVFSANGDLTSHIHASAGKTPSNEFQNGLCSCPGSDISTCCTGVFCPCILYSKLQYRLGKRSKRANPTELLGWSKCDSACISFAALSLCGLCGVLAGFSRGRVRRAYGIDGGTASDCIEGCCCCCCTLVQSDREICAREEDRMNGIGARRAYQPQASMVYQAGGS